jgi:hypothetical protein
MNTKFHTSICRVCGGFLYHIKNIRGEETGNDVALLKCNNCSSYFSKIEFSRQTLNDFSGGSINVYNKDYVLNRVQDIISYSLKKNWSLNFQLKSIFNFFKDHYDSFENGDSEDKLISELNKLFVEITKFKDIGIYRFM